MSTSRGAPSGRLRLRSDPALQFSLLHGSIWDWGSVNEVQTLQGRIRSLTEKGIGLVNVVQVMLVRRTLPCQRRPLRMWEFNLEGQRTLQHFFGTTHEGMWKLYFGEREQWSDTTEDVSLDCNHPDTAVSIQTLNTFHSSIS